MKNLFIRRIGLAAAAGTLSMFLLAFSSAQTFAQTNDEAGPPDVPQVNQDAGWATLLGLTQEQVDRIRAIRQQNRIEWQSAKQRVHRAQRALDQAIYSDDVNEAQIEQLSREVAEAQAADVRLRAMTELSIRRVLTAQQLNTFRAIREQRIREAQAKRRLQNASQQRPLRGRRMGNGPLTDVRPEAQPGGPQNNRGRAPVFGPRQRRGELPGRIRP
jgi:Spy/CpxP family protein refolding chaperone